jgi:hypothetical protein
MTFAHNYIVNIDNGFNGFSHSVYKENILKSLEALNPMYMEVPI